ncbi:MAG: hypothetical protein WC761_00695 [Candidatus Paceibacterota bacterium]|jgi:hypothetical protein
MARFNVFGLGVRNGSARNGGLNTQPIRPPSPAASLPGTQVSTTELGGQAVNVSLPQLGAGAITTITLGDRGLNSITANGFIRPILQNAPQVRLLKPFVLFPKATYPVDTLNVSQTRIVNGQFVPVMDNGISVFRPEIISIVDFAPIWKHGNRLVNSDVGDFINVQFQASHLRQETLLKLVDRIQKNSSRTTSDNQFNQVRSDYLNELRNIETNLSYFKDILQNIDNLKKALEIKKIPASFYNNTTFLPLQQFFEKRMQYPRSQFSIFSDTKILLQLLSDFRAIMEAYSISLLELRDPDREGDYSPVVIDKTYSFTNGFTFDISNLRSVTASINATENNFFNQFISSLPQSPDDRIRILTTLLSKEYLISKGLGKQNIQRLLQTFGAEATGNPFDNIIGEVGNTIFEKPKGPASLASMLYIDPGIPDANVLPFESKYVDSDDQKFVYVPGSAYFADTVLSTQGNNWNTGPFVNYVNQFNSRVKDARTVIENLFDLNNLANTLSPTFVNDRLLNSVKSATGGLLETTNIDTDQAVISAIFKLAATDNELKNMLFQYCVLVGMAANSTTEQKEIFDILASTELSDLSKMSYLQIPAGSTPNPTRGMSVLRPYIDQLANVIETRVNALTTKININFVRTFNPIDLTEQIRPAVTSTTINLGAGNSFGSRIIGTSGILSLFGKTNSVVSIQVQRGNISRILTSLVTNRTQNSSNFIKEYVDIANRLYKSAQVQGTNVHLLQDNSNRTRYNFLSSSTQLLMLFELMCSYVNRYSFSSFERSNSFSLTTITIDTLGNKVIRGTIEQIIRKPYDAGITAGIISSTIKINTSQIAKAAGSSTPSIQVTAPGGSTQNIGRGGSIGISPALRKSFSLVKSANSSLSNNRTNFSNAVFTQASKTLTDILQNNNSFNETLATNIAQAINIRDLSQTIGNPELVKRLLLPNDKYSTYRISLADNRRKIGDETVIVGNCLHILTMIATYMQNASSKIQSVFNQQTLQTFIANSGITNLNLLRNPAQVKTAAFLLENYKNKTPVQGYNQDTNYVYNNLVVSDVVSQQEYGCLKALLSETPFSNTTAASLASAGRIKILSVGIPSGFSKELVDRVNIDEISSNTFSDKEFDVISVNVYKRDARFDDIVYKPQNFLFDLSLFPLEADINRINPVGGETFDRLLLRAQITDFQQLTNTRKVSLVSIESDPRYNFLQNSEKRNLIRSHLTSHLLGAYVNFMSGIRVSEDVFLQTPLASRDLTPLMQRIVFSYLRDVKRANLPATQTIEQLLANKNITEDVKDVLRLFDYGSVVFNSGEVTGRVLTPKLFDRVFNIPLNIENFEIDLDLTLSTESGRNAWNQSYVQNKVIEKSGKYYMLPRNKNELIFEDYFVAIETANDKE